jgi:hypothetical protein
MQVHQLNGLISLQTMLIRAPQKKKFIGELHILKISRPHSKLHMLMIKPNSVRNSSKNGKK